MSYARFAAIIAMFAVAMLVVMHLDACGLDHMYPSESLGWVALVTGAATAVIMMGFLLGMYANQSVNVAIFIAASAVFVVTLYLLRSRDAAGDADRMKAMIPRSCIAMLTGSRAPRSGTDRRLASLC